jgi:hypothetical protein
VDVMRANPRAGKPGPWNLLREPRIGVMLHFDHSASDHGAVEWLLADPDCKVSYNWLVLDDGTVRDIAPHNARAFHAGACRPSPTFKAGGVFSRAAGRPDRDGYVDANSAFYGVALAASPGDTVPRVQRYAVRDLVAACFQANGWSYLDADFRLTDHATEAWPRGRKVDLSDLLVGFSLKTAVADVLGLFPTGRA